MGYQPKKKPPSPQWLGYVIKKESEAALMDTARFLRSKAAKYPPKTNSSSYKRTGTMGKSIAIDGPHVEGLTLVVYVGTNLHYAPYVERGTGIYGPKGTVITPVSAQVLAWRQTGSGTKLVGMGLKQRKGKLVRNRAGDQYMIFAKYVRGMKGWRYMQKAFEDPATQAFYQGRLTVMYARIAKSLKL